MATCPRIADISSFLLYIYLPGGTISYLFHDVDEQLFGRHLGGVSDEEKLDYYKYRCTTL